MPRVVRVVRRDGLFCHSMLCFVSNSCFRSSSHLIPSQGRHCCGLRGCCHPGRCRHHCLLYASAAPDHARSKQSHPRENATGHSKMKLFVLPRDKLNRERHRGLRGESADSAGKKKRFHFSPNGSLLRHKHSASKENGVTLAIVDEEHKRMVADKGHRRRPVHDSQGPHRNASSSCSHCPRLAHLGKGGGGLLSPQRKFGLVQSYSWNRTQYAVR